LGESEIREANLVKAEYLSLIGDKVIVFERFFRFTFSQSYLFQNKYLKGAQLDPVQKDL
jgi:hypothetical protein